MSEIQFVFRDSQGHKRSFTMGAGEQTKFMTAFNNFIQKHVSDDDSTFRLERVLTNETLIIETAHGIVGRVHDGESAEVSYRRYERRTDGADLQLWFAVGGHAALDDFGPWTPDRESLLRDDSFENLELAWVRELREEALRRREIAAMPKLDKKALKQFCLTWADTGYNEYVGDAEAYYVLFDSRTVDEVGAARDELLSAVETLGLHVVEAPASASSGEVWVRCDPRVDVELEKWA